MQFIVDKLPAFVASLCLLLFCAVAYWQLMPIYEHYQNPNADIDLTPQKAIQTASVKPTRNISSFKLFGDPAVIKTKPVKEIKNLPKTTLKLVLRGVSAGEKDERNSALIEGPDKKTEFYKIGDPLPGKADLDSIYADRVVLKRNGRLENLYFPAVSKGGGPLFTTEADPEDDSNTTITSPKPVAARGIQAGGNKSKVISPRTKSIKDRLSSIRERIRSGQY